MKAQIWTKCLIMKDMLTYLIEPLPHAGFPVSLRVQLSKAEINYGVKNISTEKKCNIQSNL